MFRSFETRFLCQYWTIFIIEQTTKDRSILICYLMVEKFTAVLNVVALYGGIYLHLFLGCYFQIENSNFHAENGFNCQLNIFSNEVS